MSSTCFEPESSYSGKRLYVQVCYSVVRFTCISISSLKTKLRGLSPRANYTDRAAAAGRRN